MELKHWQCSSSVWHRASVGHRGSSSYWPGVTAVPLQSVYCGGAAQLLLCWQEFSAHALNFEGAPRCPGRALGSQLFGDFFMSV
eukprot:634878-Rhodomonas_salina.1